ncbi:radical SAM protein [Thermoanaerobacter sp. RKWS2]|uniref:radical SAM protein n=1 Tax=Thermoanaerobacter sp. RKWS2 TaxID=2983842 RepID=UPI00224A6672|nr:radical SAM protein [Thermoanaerobacter sp. RKWS2]UZQ83954.1 radical SAM protein [Thermoanaerobacter sp. RKWS2]
MKTWRAINDYHVIGPVDGPDSEWLVYHPLSMSLFVVDELKGKVLQLKEKGYSIADISLITRCNSRMCERIFEESEEIFQKKTFELKKRSGEKSRKSGPHNIWFFVSTGCNMACSYCYASGGDFKSFPKEIMKKETAQIAVQKLSQLLGDSITTVSFFGGEPLLAFETIKVIVEEFIKNGIMPRFAVSTNGTLLDHKKLDFLLKHNFSVTVSIDGSEDVHDHNRRFTNGTKTFKHVMENVEILKNRGVRLSVQATYTYYAFNAGYTLIDIVDFLSSIASVIAIKKEEQFPLLSGKIDVDNLVSNPKFYNICKDYITYVFDRLSSSEPVFDLAITRAIGEVVNKVHSDFYPCGFKAHLTVFPDGSVYSCHLLTNLHLKLTDNILNLEKNCFYNKYEEIEEWLLEKFRDLNFPLKVWFSDFQDLCPAALISLESDPLLIKKRFGEFINFESLFWDEVLKKIYIMSKKGNWQKILENISHYFGGRKNA